MINPANSAKILQSRLKATCCACSELGLVSPSSSAIRSARGSFSAPGTIAEQLTCTNAFSARLACRAVFTHCSARSHSPSSARCCRVPAGNMSFRAMRSASMRASSSAGATGSHRAVRPPRCRSSIGTFAGALFPALDGRAVPIAAAVAIVFAFLQWRGIVWGSNIQNVTSLLKALAFRRSDRCRVYLRR